VQALLENHDLSDVPALAGLTLRRQGSPAEQVQGAGHRGRAAAYVACDGKALRQRTLLRVTTACALEVDLGPAPRSA